MCTTLAMVAIRSRDSVERARRIRGTHPLNQSIYNIICLGANRNRRATVA